jgi:hypothetical protein
MLLFCKIPHVFSRSSFLRFLIEAEAVEDKPDGNDPPGVEIIIFV